MDMPLTAHTRLILNLARQQASRLHAAQVADEHVLLAILHAEEPGIGQMALRKLGIDPVALTESLEAAARHEHGPRPRAPRQNDPDGELSRLVPGARRAAAEPPRRERAERARAITAATPSWRGLKTRSSVVPHSD